MGFSSGSESRHNQKSGSAEEESSKQKGRSMRKTFDHRILYGQMDDGRQRGSALCSPVPKKKKKKLYSSMAW